MLKLKDIEHISLDWVDMPFVKAFVYSEIEEIQPSNPLLDSSEPISVPLLVSPPNKDYGEFAFGMQALVPVSRDEQDSDLILLVFADFHYEEDPEVEGAMMLMPLETHTALCNRNEEDILMLKEVSQSESEREVRMEVLPEFYEHGYTDADIKRWGIVV